MVIDKNNHKKLSTSIYFCKYLCFNNNQGTSLTYIKIKKEEIKNERNFDKC